MTKSIVFEGVPASISRDGWWLDAGRVNSGAGEGGSEPRVGGLRDVPVWLWLLCFVVLADVFFWHHAPGLSLVLFTLLIFALAVLRAGPRRAHLAPGLLMTASALPALVHMQTLSAAFLLLGLAVSVAWVWRWQDGARRAAQAGVHFFARLPGLWVKPVFSRQSFVALRGAIEAVHSQKTDNAIKSLLRKWAFPLGGAMVLAALLMEANPLLTRFPSVRIDGPELVGRMFFWGGIALLVAPFLSMHMPDAAPRQGPSRTLPRLGINRDSVLRALIVFNGMMAVQTFSDLSILVAGADLPDGMSFASYAHRGAYPLLATALLAGAFALAARPFLAEHKAMLPLLLVWLGQNMAVCFAAMLRLDLYVSEYGLTYLRVHALIWMVLVAAWLMLIGWQCLRGHANRWLVLRSFAMGLATLYVCSMINFAGMIARHNIDMPRTDVHYLCQLGPTAASALLEKGFGRPPHDGHIQVFGQYKYLSGTTTCRVPLPQDGNWREWGYRTWSETRYVEKLMQAEVAQ